MKIDDVVAPIDEIGDGSSDLGEFRLKFHVATASVDCRVVQAMRDALRWPLAPQTANRRLLRLFYWTLG